jgi:hypothetical protein
MKCKLLSGVAPVAAVFTLLTSFAAASPREVALPAGTLLQCTLNEPNFSSATADIGDPVVCHLRGVNEFGQQAFPRGSYLVGHLESAKEPGHFVGKGSLKLQFDRIGLPSGDLPLEAKMIGTRGYRVDREGKIIGKGHATRDVVEWMLPPLWPWKVITLPAKGPRPKLKGETTLELRLMDDLLVPQLASIPEPGFHFFSRPQPQSFNDSQADTFSPKLADRNANQTQEASVASYAIYMPAGQNLARPETVAQASRAVSPASPVFVLKTGPILSIGNYTYHDGRITYTLAAGGGGVIGSDEIDWTATTWVNSTRGVRITLRSGPAAAITPGL